jgi:plastocyanin
MPPARAGKATLLAACLVLVLSACGHTQVVGVDRTIQIAVSEYRVAPQRVTVRAGPLTVVVHNFGRLVHNLAVTGGGRTWAQTRPIRPGATAVLTLQLASGSYGIASTLFDDESLGIYGSLYVTR